MALYSVSEIKIVQDHEAILEAIRKQNGTEAKALLKKHLSRYKIDAAAIRERFPEYF
jgi:DNA-binding GntR family transcriptional regulator